MINWKKVVSTSVLSSAIIFSSFAPMFGSASNHKVSAAMAPTIETKLPYESKHHGGPFDIGIAHPDKLMDRLIADGVISASASEADKQKALTNYLKKRQAAAEKIVEEEPTIEEARKEMQQQAGLKLKAAKDPKNADGWNGEVVKDKVLVILMDFPDLPNSSITPDEGPVLYYENYPKEHYEQMIFGDFYVGPNGEELISVKKFYEEQSGGSYTIEGQVAGWYTAENNADYYGGNDAGGNDAHPRELTYEALMNAAMDPSINLAEFDQEDPYDLDSDGDFREPDGIIDHLMIVHAGIGEEAGGGKLGEDAIWSHSWSLPGPTPIPGTEGLSEVPYWGEDSPLAGYAYIVQPEDGAAGVFVHEYGHDLGLPDEYDSIYSGLGAATGYWTVMASGSWAGEINGAEPTGFSPDNKLDLQARFPGSNWFDPVEVDIGELQGTSLEVVLDQASVKGKNHDAVKINLPEKVTTVTEPTDGDYLYFGGSGNEVDHTLVATVDLTDVDQATLEYDTWFNIEEDWDYSFVQISVDGGETWIPLETENMTHTGNPDIYPDMIPHFPGYTGYSGETLHEVIDISDYTGQEVKIQFRYMTDWASNADGFYVDAVKVTSGDEVLFFESGEEEGHQFEFNGFEVSDGNAYTNHYYLVEWRSWAGTDSGLGNTTRGNGTTLSHDRGMVVWYVDDYYGDNWTGIHPGDGFIGVVDAHQETIYWSDDVLAASQYQIKDAAFSLSDTERNLLDYIDFYMDIPSLPAIATFDDSRDYSNPGAPDAGRNVPNYGLKIHVVDQAEDFSTGTIVLHADDVSGIDINPLDKDVYSAQEGFNQVVVTGTVHQDGAHDAMALKYELLHNGESYADGSEELVGNQFNFKQVIDITSDMPSGEYTFKVSASPVATDAPATFADDELVAEVSFEVDNDAPVIELLGDNPVELNAGDEFVDPGFKATDAQDGDLTDAVVVVSNVDTNVAGEYTVTYSVADSAGNQASATRTVIVKPVIDEEPGDDDQDGEDTDDEQGDDGGTPADGDKKGGGNLPDTATNIFNWLLAGSLTLFAGAVLYFIHRRRKASVIE
jgi:immune inhibitor A